MTAEERREDEVWWAARTGRKPELSLLFREGEIRRSLKEADVAVRYKSRWSTNMELKERV